MSANTILLVLLVVVLLSGWPAYRYGGYYGGGGVGLLLLVVIVLLLLGCSSAIGAEAPQGPKVSELAQSRETLWQFISHLPSTAEFEIGMALLIFGVVGMFGSFWWKWSQDQIVGNPLTYFFVHPKNTIYSIGTFVSLSITALTTGVYFSPSNEFVGWWNVIYTALITGFGVDVAANKGVTKVFTPEEREAARQELKQ